MTAKKISISSTTTDTYLSVVVSVVINRRVDVFSSDFAIDPSRATLTMKNTQLIALVVINDIMKPIPMRAT